jgi:hypothetical protein
MHQGADSLNISRIKIGPRVDEQADDFSLPQQGCIHERSHLLTVSGVHIRPLLETVIRPFHAAVPCRPEQSRIQPRLAFLHV